jgi:hypothetical protein
MARQRPEKGDAPKLEKTKDFYLPPDAPRKMCGPQLALPFLHRHRLARLTLA